MEIKSNIPYIVTKGNDILKDGSFVVDLNYLGTGLYAMWLPGSGEPTIYNTREKLDEVLKGIEIEINKKSGQEKIQKLLDEIDKIKKDYEL